MGKLASWLASHVTDLLRIWPTQYPDSMLYSVWNNVSGSFCADFDIYLISVQSWLVSLELFFFTSSMEIYQVNELLSFVLPMRSMNYFQFIHYMTFSHTQSYYGSFMASNFRVMLFTLRRRSSFCLHTVCIFEYVFRMNVPIGLGLTDSIHEILPHTHRPVSYTHLTLPTTASV